MVAIMKDTVEKSVFGVCSYLAQKLGIKASSVRIYFVYISFVTIGSPIVIYLFFAFWLNIRQYLRKNVTPLLN